MSPKCSVVDFSESGCGVLVSAHDHWFEISATNLQLGLSLVAERLTEIVGHDGSWNEVVENNKCVVEWV